MRAPFAIFAATIVAVAAAACGARTELRVPPIRHHDAGEDVLDAGPDVVDAPEDAPPDVIDAPEEPPPIIDCEDAGITYVYLITSGNILARFFPPSGVIETIGTIECPVADPSTDFPFSMAVDRAGIAWVLFNTGDLYRVSTATASCQATSFVADQLGFHNFGMGYSANVDDAGGETLYIANDVANTMMNGELGTIDTFTFNVSDIGMFSGMIGNAELTGTKDGRLFAFGVENNNGESFVHLAEVDKSNGKVIGDQFITLPTGNDQILDWAFAFWGGDFYFFTSNQEMNANQTALVSRYTPGDPTNMAVPVTTFNSPIVGAGVSTCAPAQ